MLTGHSRGKESDLQIGSSVIAGDQNKQGKLFTEIFGIGAGNASEKENNDNIDQYLNIDNLPEGGLQVKIVFKTESGNILVRIPCDETTKCLVRQVCDKHWHAAANSITKHSELFPEVLKAVNKNASNEISEYLKSESMLLSNKPDEITGFSNTIFLEELRIFCPVVYHFVLSACGIQESDVKVKGIAANGEALATAVMSSLRNPKASVFYYRISTVLFTAVQNTMTW